MRAGAVDFVVKPHLAVARSFDPEALKIEALSGEITRIKKRPRALTFDDLVIRGAAMQRVIALGQRAAASSIPVLIEGRSGVGRGSSRAPSRAKASAPAGRSSPSTAARSPRTSSRKHPVRPQREGLVHRRRRPSASSRRRTAARCSSTRSANCRSMRRSSFCRALQEGEIDPVGAKRPVRSTSASSRRRTAT